VCGVWAERGTAAPRWRARLARLERAGPFSRGVAAPAAPTTSHTPALSLLPPSSPHGSPAPGPRSRAVIAAEIAAENDWKNALVLGRLLDHRFAAALPRPLLAWGRSYLAGLALYFGVGGAWAYYAYWVFGDVLFPAPGSTPSRPAVLAQVRVAMAALPLYAALPAVVEAAAEAGLTRAYTRIGPDAGGLLPYWALFAAYMACVEWGVYWAHRGLHDWRAGYDALHAKHHIYNKEHTLSPFAGLAFHPLDGICQASPYAVALFLIPAHFLTHELLLFATAIWTANIHDALDGRAAPIMGAGFHAIHHTTYKHNYGQYFTYADAAHGTLVTPAEYAAGKVRKGGGGVEE